MLIFYKESCLNIVKNSLNVLRKHFKENLELFKYFVVSLDGG